MRINKFIADSSSLSRRSADQAIKAGRVTINDEVALIGSEVNDSDKVSLDGIELKRITETITLVFNKPVGYVVSRDGQGSSTVFDLLPEKYQKLNPIGRLDKNSSGLLLFTNDGYLAQKLTHPSHHKIKIYHVKLDSPLSALHHQILNDHGIMLEDGISKLVVQPLQSDIKNTSYEVIMSEGRNRQIRRTFSALGYTVTHLHRIQFGDFKIKDLKSGEFREVK